jgi:hypothetical protein
MDENPYQSPQPTTDQLTAELVAEEARGPFIVVLSWIASITTLFVGIMGIALPAVALWLLFA